MSGITVVAKLVVKEESVASVKAELLKLVAPTMQEEGCIEYRLHQDGADPALFIFYENWQSMDCLEQHMNSVHFNRYLAAVDGKLAEKVVYKMTEIS